MVRSTRVLVVGTEHTDALQGVGDALAAADAAVTEAPDATAALDDVDDYDCVVTTDALPDTEGVAFVETVHERFQGVPVVFVAADGSERLASDAVSAGATEYVPAGDGVDAVVAAVERSLGARAAGDGGTVGRLGDDVSFDLKEQAMDAAPVGITISDFQREDNPLVYVNESFEALTGYDRVDVLGRNCRFLQGEDTDESTVDVIREAIDAEEETTVELLNYRADGTPFWNRLDIAPLENDGEVTNFVGFQSDITKRKEAEAEAKRRADQLAHLVDRVDGVLQEATAMLVAADSRSTVQADICALLADTDPYVGAWVATTDLSGDTLTPAEGAGVDTAGLDAITVADLASDDPTRAALTAGTVESAPVDALPDDGRRTVAPDGATTFAAIPLVYGETTYGVCHLYAAGDDGFDERERAILGSLGKMVGAGINAVETKRIIASTEVVRVAFETGDRDLFFVDLAAETGATLDHVGSTVPDDGPPTMTFTVSGASPEEIEAFAAEAPALAAVNVIAETETDVLVEFDLASDSIVALLAEYGAKTRAITASGGTARIEVEVPQGDAARQLVDVVTDRYAETDMASYREDASTERTRPEFAAAVRDQLTDRQFTALQRAYAAEFFAWPRPVSGGELAESMDISRPTFHQHLRAAQRKLVTAFFEDNPDR